MGIYAGDISAADAWSFLSGEKDAYLIDVRTEAEWKNDGIADLSKCGKEIVGLSWRVYPNYDVNQSFIQEFESLDIPKDAKLFFICKAGGRSMEAAGVMTSCGYGNCFNVIGGMEGDGLGNGWKASNLPWGRQ